MAESSGLPDYFQRYNPDLLKLIPPDAERVLEIGCGAGKLAEAYRRINPGVFWAGVEKNLDAVKLAKNHLDRVGHECVSRISAFTKIVPDWTDFDCLILGDVIEHLESPQDVIAALIRLVKPGGQVIASIPNASNWKVIDSLLRGEFEYEDEGLFDRTHLRWFTRKSAVKMFRDAGLHVFESTGRVLEAEGHNSFLSQINQLAFAPELWQTMKRDTMVYQNIIRAVKSEEPIPRMLIRYLVGCIACEHVRCSEPGAFLRTIPGVAVEVCRAESAEQVMALGELDWEQDNYEHKVLILQRFAAPDDQIGMLKDEGWTIIFEIDDYPLAKVDNFPKFVEDDCRAMRACHAIQTTTDVMKATLERLCPDREVMAFPNQIAELPPFPEEKFDEEDRKLKVFFGAINRPDWKPILHLINEMEDHEWIVVNDREFFDALKSEHKQFVPYVPYPIYRNLLRSCDVALLPLEDNEFNRHKSDLKLIECAAEGVIPSLDFGIYRDIGVGFELLEAIGYEYELDDADGSYDNKVIARKAYKHVRDNRLLSQHYRKLYDFYLRTAERVKAESTKEATNA